MLASSIIAVLTVIESIIPLLGTSAATAAVIANIIDALIKLLPFIIDEIGTVYTSVKNIISLLQSSGAPMTPDQITALQQLDAQVDAAWAKVLPSIDPDNPANVRTPAGDPGKSST